MSPYADPEAQREYNREYRKRWRKLNPEKAKAADFRRTHSEGGIASRKRADAKRKGQRSAYEHKRSLKRLYGITVEQYGSMLASQKGRCAICNCTDPGHGKRRLSVDHDHATGKVRGLLCNACNKGLGIFSENTIRMRVAIAYLVRSRR